MVRYSSVLPFVMCGYVYCLFARVHIKLDTSELGTVPLEDGDRHSGTIGVALLYISEYICSSVPLVSHLTSLLSI